MDMNIIDGKKIAQSIKDDIKNKIEIDYIQKGKEVPCLACIIVEGNASSEIYVNNKKKACENCGIKSRIVRLKNDISQDELMSEIAKLNSDDSVSGILLQLPLPDGLDDRLAINSISPDKDVDGLTSVNLGKLFAKEQTIAPCTATGIIKILDYENVQIEGKRAVVVGRSLLVGKSTGALLDQRNATVTVCHSKTQNLKEITKQADILVVAIGNPCYVDASYVKEGAVVIDVGITRTDDGLKGDVDFESVSKIAEKITPVPGGVGPLTVACLLHNTLVLHERRI